MKRYDRCRDIACGVPLVPSRTPVVQPGEARHGAHGLCTRCTGRHRRAGTMHLYPTLVWRRVELYAEWKRMARDYGSTIDSAAAELGVTRAALEKAIERTERGPGPRVQRPPRRTYAQLLCEFDALLAAGWSQRAARRRMRVCHKTVRKALASAGRK